MRAERLQRAAVGRPSVGVGKKSSGPKAIAFSRAAFRIVGLWSSWIAARDSQLAIVDTGYPVSRAIWRGPPNLSTMFWGYVCMNTLCSI